MQHIKYHISLKNQFHNLQNANKYMNDNNMNDKYVITYYMPQPKIPLFIIKLLKLLHLYE